MFFFVCLVGDFLTVFFPTGTFVHFVTHNLWNTVFVHVFSNHVSCSKSKF